MPATEVITTPDSVTQIDGVFNIGLPLALSPVPFPPGGPGVPRALADDFTVAAGVLEVDEPTLLPLADPALSHLTHTMSWGAMSAEFRPDGHGGA